MQANWSIEVVDDLLTSSDSFWVCWSSGWTPSTASIVFVTGLAGRESDSLISDTSLSENHCTWRLLSALRMSSHGNQEFRTHIEKEREKMMRTALRWIYAKSTNKKKININKMKKPILPIGIIYPMWVQMRCSIGFRYFQWFFSFLFSHEKY